MFRKFQRARLGNLQGPGLYFSFCPFGDTAEPCLSASVQYLPRNVLSRRVREMKRFEGGHMDRKELHYHIRWSGIVEIGLGTLQHACPSRGQCKGIGAAGGDLHD